MDATWIDTWRLAPSNTNSLSAFLTRPEMKYIELDNAFVRVRVLGKGPSVIFVPDAPNSIEHYDKLFETLCSKFQIICLEFPGFGFSFPKKNFIFSIDAQVKLLQETLEKLQVENCILAFSCVTAYIALRAAIEYPNLVKKLLLMQAPSWEEELKWAERVDFKGVIATPILGQLLLMFGKNIIAKAWYQVSVGKKENVSHFLTPTLEAFQKGACYCLASGFQGIFHNSKKPSFNEIKQPVSVLWGTLDKSHKKTNKRSILEHVPQAQYIETSEAGHFPELEALEEFKQALEILAKT